MNITHHETLEQAVEHECQPIRYQAKRLFNVTALALIIAGVIWFGGMVHYANVQRFNYDRIAYYDMIQEQIFKAQQREIYRWLINGIN